MKYGFEPKELMINLDREDMEGIEREASKESKKVTVLMMSDDVQKGANLFIGKDCPKGALLLSGVPTSLAGFLDFALHSDYFWDGDALRNIRVILGHNTLILNAICFALGELGAEGRSNLSEKMSMNRGGVLET